MELVQPGGSGSGTALTVTDGITTVTNVSTIDFTGATVSNGGGGTANVLVSGGGFTELPKLTGAVNGVNVTFTFSQTPSYIVSDGVWYKKLDSNGGTQWSGTTTVTMVIPPATSIFGIA
jgi:hypothetical protein